MLEQPTWQGGMQGGLGLLAGLASVCKEKVAQAKAKVGVMVAEKSNLDIVTGRLKQKLGKGFKDYICS